MQGALGATNSNIVGVDQVIDLAKRDSEIIKASEKLLEAVQSEINARDLVLSPTLTSELSMYNDHRETLSTNVTNRNNSGLVDVSLTKPFSTGTRFSLNVRHDLLRSDSFVGARDIASWEVSISQALWRDSFGRNTRLRRQAEKSELKSRQYSTLLVRQRHLISVENAFWDLALAVKEIEVRNQTIERSSALEKWVRRRIGKFAAEQTDLLQVQGLLGQRQLDLTAAKNRVEAAMNSLRAFVPSAQPEMWKVDSKVLEQERNISMLLATSGGSGEPVRLDALSSKYRATQVKSEAEQISDSLKPQLDAFVSYAANGVDQSVSGSWDRAKSANYDAGKVGVLLSVELDQGLKNQRRKSAKLTAEAEAYRATALSRESMTGWSDLRRNIENLKQQAREARELSALQNRKVTAERRRYEQGRTTALQITTFEVDASESELRLYRTLADLRKAEASARAFSFEESGI